MPLPAAVPAAAAKYRGEEGLEAAAGKAAAAEEAGAQRKKKRQRK